MNTRNVKNEAISIILDEMFKHTTPYWRCEMKVIIDLSNIRKQDEDKISEAMDFITDNLIHANKINDDITINQLLDVERWLMCYLNQTNHYTITKKV